MKLTHVLVLAAAVAAAGAWPIPAPAQGLPTQKILTIDVAQTLAQEAMLTCRANGFKVTVTVVDSALKLRQQLGLKFLMDVGMLNQQPIVVSRLLTHDGNPWPSVVFVNAHQFGIVLLINSLHFLPGNW